jgi:hypothetical protein
MEINMGVLEQNMESIDQDNRTDTDLSQPASRHQDVAQLAYAIWEENGCCDGRAEEDWLEAERRLALINHSAQQA